MLWREGLLIAWGLGCAVMDYRQRRIPNSLTVGGTIVAIVYLLFDGNSILGASPASAISAGIGVILVSIPCLWLGWLGAGDVKMMSTIGFIGGVNTLILTFVFSSFLTIVAVLFLWLKAITKNQQSTLSNLKLPQGIFLALGLILSIFGLNPE